MRLFGVLSVAGWLLLPCCGGDGSAAPMTKGDYCDATANAYCEHAQDCKLSAFSPCFKLFKRSCCLDDESCDFAPKDSAALAELEERCVPALAELTCAEVEAGTIPDACTGTP